LALPLIALLAVLAPALRAATVEERLDALEKRVWELEHPPPAAVTPAIKDRNRHDAFLQDIKKGSNDLVFIGDSITDGWRGGGKKVWDEAFGPLKPLNLGIGGDRTQHVLWRLQNGELDGYKAKCAVIMIGTNNGADSKEDVAAGITAIVKEVQKRQPECKILLLGIFPRGPKANDGARAKNAQVNQIVAKLDDGKTIRYMDIGDKFLDENKDLPKDIMPDALHPNAKGYQIWADATLPAIKELMGVK
jgi:lysophospholipase L1-like esterase